MRLEQLKVLSAYVVSFTAFRAARWFDKIPFQASMFGRSGRELL